MQEEKSTIVWPPEYKVKRHPRARRVKLSVTRTKGLVITIPPRFNIQKISEVLVENEKWILKHLVKLAAHKTDALPVMIEFQAWNERWKVSYMQSSTKIDLIERAGREIVLLGNIADHILCKKILIQWVKQKAKTYLLLQLQRISEQTQLCFHDVTIRDQQTRWGSCNREKSINLNYRLIFLPEHLVSHVIIHELCHTKHLNHSERFWNLVAKFDPLSELHKKELRKADQYIPAWLCV